MPAMLFPMTPDVLIKEGMNLLIFAFPVREKEGCGWEKDMYYKYLSRNTFPNTMSGNALGEQTGLAMFVRVICDVQIIY